MRDAGLGVPLLLLGCVLIPALPCLLILRHRRRLQSIAIKVRLGFIFCNYRSVTLGFSENLPKRAKVLKFIKDSASCGG